MTSPSNTSLSRALHADCTSVALFWIPKSLSCNSLRGRPCYYRDGHFDFDSYSDLYTNKNKDLNGRAKFSHGPGCACARETRAARASCQPVPTGGTRSAAPEGI